MRKPVSSTGQPSSLNSIEVIFHVSRSEPIDYFSGFPCVTICRRFFPLDGTLANGDCSCFNVRKGFVSIDVVDYS